MVDKSKMAIMKYLRRLLHKVIALYELLFAKCFILESLSHYNNLYNVVSTGIQTPYALEIAFITT